MVNSVVDVFGFIVCDGHTLICVGDLIKSLQKTSEEVEDQEFSDGILFIINVLHNDILISAEKNAIKGDDIDSDNCYVDCAVVIDYFREDREKDKPVFNALAANELIDILQYILKEGIRNLN